MEIRRIFIEMNRFTRTILMPQSELHFSTTLRRDEKNPLPCPQPDAPPRILLTLRDGQPYL
jgi:hypothetical protein